MNRFFLFSLVFFGLLQCAKANDQLRLWTFADGTKMSAEIIDYDESQKIVTLRLENQSLNKFKDQEFSTIDRAWILQWVEMDEEARILFTKIGGQISEHVSIGVGEFKINYAVYQPPTTTDVSNLPMLILFHPGGNGRRQIYKYIEAASKVGITLVSLDYFKNTTDEKIDSEMAKNFELLLPQIEANVRHDKNRVYMGGTSGGAYRAYHYTALVKRPWAGIFAAGGWLGGVEYYALPYPPLRVAMVNGDKDAAANAWIERDSQCLQKAGGIISIHAFEGGHQLPPPSVQEKAFQWLLAAELPNS
jgi:poly(3-hydroxybutyrate) depolymerase